MNRRTLALTVALSVLVLGAAVWLLSPNLVVGQGVVKDGDKDDKHVLTVSGSGTVRVKPDSARLFFTIESYADLVRSARADNAGKVQKVMKALTELKIEGLKTKSDNITVQQLTENNNGRQLPRVIGYHVTNTFTVLVENDDRVKLSSEASRVLDAVLENGGTGVSQIMFFKKGADAEKLRRQAMTKAVEDALANGRALLAGMNRDKLEPLTVSVSPEHPWAGRMQNYNNTMIQQGPPGAGGDDTATNLMAGELVFSYTVSMTCKY